MKVVVADRAATRLGMRLALRGVATVSAEAPDYRQAIRLVMQHQPDLCLVGTGLEGEVVGAVLGITRASPASAVVVLAEEGDVEELLEVLRSGAVGYVPGPLDAEGLRRVVRAVARGEAIIPRELVLDLILELRTTGVGVDMLPARESQVLGMLRRGRTTAEIAERLSIAPVTVRRHISELVHKLGVEDRAALSTPRDVRHGPGRGRDEARNG